MSTVLVDLTQLAYYTGKQDTKNNGKFVAKETGKSLISDDEITRLSGVATGAQVNVLESVSVNGTAQTITSKSVDITVPTKVSDITNDSDFQSGEQVQAAINAKVASAYKAGGSKTAAQLTSALLTAANEGVVYNMSEPISSTSDFIEGEGKTFPAGTDIGVIETTAASYVATSDTTAQDGKTYYADANGTALGAQPTTGADISSSGYYEYVAPTYKFNAMAGFVDLSGYQQTESGKGLSKNDFTDAYKAKLDSYVLATNSDIDGIFSTT